MVRPVPRRALRVPCTLLPVLLATLPWLGCDGARDPGADHEARFESLRARAVALHDRGDDAAATLAALEAALALRPEHPGLNQRLGRLCLSLRLNARALEALERVHAARPGDVPTLLSIVSLLVKLGRFEQALERVPAALDDPELRGEALYQQALALEQLGQREAARAAARESDELPPARGYRCQALLGRLLLEDGELSAAHERFERARAGRPDHREALKGLADCARRLGREDEAGRWDRLLGLFVQLNDSAFARAPDQAAERRATLETLMAEYPEWSAGFEQLAELQRAQGDLPAACATIEAWLTRHGAGLAANARAALRRRYCEDAP